MKHFAKFIPCIFLTLTFPFSSAASSSHCEEEAGEYHIPLKNYKPSKHPNKPGKPIIATYNEINHTLSLQIPPTDVRPITISVESPESFETFQYNGTPISLNLEPNIVYRIVVAIESVNYEGEFIYM